MNDWIFENTKGLNEWFKENKTRRNVLLIFCSGLLDVNMLISFYKFVMCSKTYRFIICILVFYVMRAALILIFDMPYPQGYNWGYPGWLSLFVPYGKTNDFFYSGHVGICMITFMEFKANECHKLAIYSLFVMIAEIFLMLATRAHYTIDMVSGLIFSHYIWIMADKYSYIIDTRLIPTIKNEDV